LWLDLREQIKIHDEQPLAIIDIINDYIELHLRKRVGDKNFLILPFGRSKIGICVHVPKDGSSGRQKSLELCGNLVSQMRLQTHLVLSIGIGRTKENATGLSESYHEAATAYAYAVFFKKTQIVHIDDVQDPKIKELDMLFDLGDFGLSIKTGNIKSALQQFDDYYSGMVQASQGDFDFLRMRSFTLMSVIMQNAFSVGLSNHQVIDTCNRFFNELITIKDQHSLHMHLVKMIEEISNAVSLLQMHKLSRVVVQAKSYIEDNCHQALNSSQVAEQIGMSPSYLNHFFRKETGMTLSDYITWSRIAEAKKLLIEPETSVTEVAYTLGFNDSNYFSTVFRKTEGMSPSQYRKHALARRTS